MKHLTFAFITLKDLKDKSNKPVAATESASLAPPSASSSDETQLVTSKEVVKKQKKKDKRVDDDGIPMELFEGEEQLLDAAGMWSLLSFCGWVSKRKQSTISDDIYCYIQPKYARETPTAVINGRSRDKDYFIDVNVLFKYVSQKVKAYRSQHASFSNGK